MSLTSLRSLEHLPLSRGPMRLLFLGVALAIVAHIQHQPPWVPALALAALAWRFWIMEKGLALPNRWIRAVIALASSLAVISAYGTLMGRDAGIAMLIVMLGLKLLETKTLRDAMFATFIGYFVVITSFFYTQTLPMAGYMLLILVVMTAALIGLGSGQATIPLASRLRTAGLLLIQSIPIMLVLFVLFPRLSGPLWGTISDETTGVTGLAEDMSPGNISRLTRSDAVAFRVTFRGDPPPSNKRYWRGPVLWRYDGSTWKQRPETRINAFRYVPRDEALQYTVTLEPHNKRWLLALDIPAVIPKEAFATSDYQLLADKPVRKLSQYRVASHLEYVVDPQLSVEARARALRLPAGVSPRAHSLARSWRARAANDVAVIEQALRYFREQPFVYTLNPPLLNGDGVDQFLFETRRGFCEHYASSFTLLMRAAGIPARVVIGYQGGEWNPLGQYLLVRQADAHAWVEVWLPERGWVRIDPTATIAPERIEHGIGAALAEEGPLHALVGADYAGSVINALGLVWDTLNFQWNEWVIAFGPEKQQELIERLGLNRLTRNGITTVMVVAVAVLMLAYAALFAWWHHRPPADPLSRTYWRFCRKLARAGFTRAPHEGPVDFSARVARVRPDLAGEVTTITQLYTQVRYSKGTERMSIKEMKKHVRALHVRP